MFCLIMVDYKTIVILLVTFLRFVISDILVHLPDGTIRGKESTSYKNKTFYSFLKIPYASPPVGNLRFKAPIPPKKWNGVLNTTDIIVMCYQVEINLPMESEDCLYINVYTPELPTTRENKRGLAVMLWIYGGGFISGFSLPFIFGPEFFLDYEIVLVTFNYRLGPFGFLSTGDEVIPGNYGLKDQQLAIQWTYNNIKLFGGDPEKITIFGQSAGSASVSYQLLNKKNKNFVKAAILESGSALSVWSLQRNPKEIALKTAKFINSNIKNNTNSKDLLTFLTNVSADRLDKASFDLAEDNFPFNILLSQGFIYGPVIEPIHDGAFITKKVYNLIKSGDFIRVPIIIGMNSEEAVQVASDLTLFRGIIAALYDNVISSLVPLDMNIKSKKTLQIVGTLIHQMYTNTTFQNYLAGCVKYISDNSFTRSIIRHAELQSKYSQVYFYQFSYDGLLGNVTSPIKELEHGVAHVEELRYMWQMTYLGFDNTDLNKFPKADIITHERLLKMWTDFAKTLNPTPEKCDLLQNIVWPTVNSEKPTDLLYLDINSNLTIMNRPREETFSKWKEIYNAFGIPPYDTY